jgi:hypothetical protein
MNGLALYLRRRGFGSSSLDKARISLTFVVNYRYIAYFCGENIERERTEKGKVLQIYRV